jgi:hypothetical protein
MTFAIRLDIFYPQIYPDFLKSEFFNSHAWLRQLSVNSKGRGRAFPNLLQLRVLCFGFFQDGNVGVSALP